MSPEPTRKQKCWKLIPWVITSLYLSLVFAVIITFFLDWPSGKVIAQWKQPADITYDNRGPYYLSVVERDMDWSRIPFQRNYEIYVGCEADPSYGHWIKYSFHPSHPDDIEQFLSKATVQWTPEGVALELPSGHRLFVPEHLLTGGR